MELYTIHTGGTGEIEEKKSRFIATVAPVSSEEEAAAFIASMKKKYWDARHNCSAFITGDRGEKSRCSDDGEPSGTAGRPMLDVLEGAHVTNVCVVVTRYFGGTLLGTGGLVRAYSAAVRAALDNCTLIKKLNGYLLKVTLDYNDYGKIEREAAKKGYLIHEKDYGENVTVSFLTEDADAIRADVTDMTAGRAAFYEPVPTVYAVTDSGAMIFSQAGE